MHESMKVISFDFDFQYPRGGNQDVANAITVCEPTWGQRQVYTTIRSYLGETSRLLTLAFSDVPRRTPAEAETDEATQEAAAEAPSATDIDHLERMRFAMSVDAFGKAYDYITKQLTNNKSLAYVGSDTTVSVREREPITDLVWMNIAKAGGMEAVDKILAGFLSFFESNSRAKPTEGDATSGSNSPSTLPASQGAASKSRKH